MKYNAFISYSHRQDSHLAPSLEKGLEQFAKPTFKRRALNIFRDSNDLSASPDLWGKIEDGLSQSDYFIFLASPAAAQSRWCKKEVDHWKANRTIDHFLVVLTEGELVWDEAKSDFDWTKTTAIPENLSGAFKNEPLYVDFRDATSETELNLDNPDFKTKVVLLAATLHGKAVGDMVGEGVRQHKRTIRIRNSAIMILSLLFLTSIVLTFYAFEQKNVAEKEKREAIRQANRALAKSYLSDSKANLELDPTLALRLAEYAYRFASTSSLDLENYEDQLIRAYYNPTNFYLSHGNFQLDNDSIKEIREFNNYKFELLENTGSSDILYFVMVNGTRVPFPDYWWGLPEKYGFSPNGKFIITNRIDPGGSFAGTRDVLNIFNLEMKELAEVQSYVAWETRGLHRNIVKFDATETRFIITGEDPGTSIYDIRSNEMLSLILYGPSRDVTDIDISADGTQVALAQRKGIVDIYTIGSYESQLRKSNKKELRGHNLESLEAISFSEDDHYLFTQSATIKRKWHSNNDMLRRYVNLKERPFGDEIVNLSTEGDHGTVNFEYEQHEVRGESEEYGEYVDYIDGWRIDYISKMGDTIARFHTTREPPMDEYETNELNKWSSPDGRYYASRNGLFNNRNELLIDYNETRHQYKWDIVTMGFSADSKFFFLVDKIYFLDAEQILARINDPILSGDIARISREDKERYLITGIEIPISESDYPQKTELVQTIETKDRHEEAPKQEDPVEPEEVMVQKVTITVDNLRLRNSPDLNGETITNLKTGSLVTLLGELSTNQTTVTIGGKQITDYWQKVETADKKIGWIHGCCFKPE